jgi:hypothetical protein
MRPSLLCGPGNSNSSQKTVIDVTDGGTYCAVRVLMWSVKSFLFCSVVSQCLPEKQPYLEVCSTLHAECILFILLWVLVGADTGEQAG